MPIKYREDAKKIFATDQSNKDIEPLTVDAIKTGKLGYNFSSFEDPTDKFVYNKAACEFIPPRDERLNAWIVFGRDRVSGLTDKSYGQMGVSKCSSIDIVVGRVSALNANHPDNIGKLVNPSFGGDAARILLSQKTDVDDNFQLAKGKTGPSIGKSAITMKADAIRLIARDSLKIVTNTDYKLSNDDNPVTGIGIQLIANNDDSDLQPIPKGKSLLTALEKILDTIGSLNGILTGFMQIQNEFNRQVQQHTHVSPFMSKDTSLSRSLGMAGDIAASQIFVKVDQGLKFHKAKIEAAKQTFILGKTAINSKWNFTN